MVTGLRALISVFLNLHVLARVVSLHDIRSTCRKLPGLTKEQMELCYKATELTKVAIEGLEVGIKECQYQFQWHRWNCSTLSTKKQNLHTSSLLRRGYRESAFVSAILAAGVAHQVSRACSQGRLVSCGCDPSVNRRALTKSFRDSLERENRLVIDQMGNHISDDTFQIKSLGGPGGKKRNPSRWKWGGCSHNMDFGIEFSKVFLDSREKAAKDIQSQISLHNNNAGRTVVLRNEIVRCKCHGVSGGCNLKTCWKSAPDFRVVGKVLKMQFKRAMLVDQSNLGNGPAVVVMKPIRNKKVKGSGRRALKDVQSLSKSRRLETSLFYYQRSPNFCDRDQGSDIPGTVGRICNQTSSGSDGCASMCCGRGYNLVRERKVEKCNCKFHWCCFVECQECQTEEWISICK